VRVEVGGVDAPGQGLLDLGAALGPHVLDPGVGEDLGGGGGQEAVGSYSEAAPVSERQR